MKVVKLKAGYRVTCTDSEFEALRFIVAAAGAGPMERANHTHLSIGAKKVIRREPFTGDDGPLMVTEDRR